MGDEVKASANGGFHLQPVPASKRRKPGSPIRGYEGHLSKKMRIDDISANEPQQPSSHPPSMTGSGPSLPDVSRQTVAAENATLLMGKAPADSSVATNGAATGASASKNTIAVESRPTASTPRDASHALSSYNMAAAAAAMAATTPAQGSSAPTKAGAMATVGRSAFLSYQTTLPDPRSLVKGMMTPTEASQSRSTAQAKASVPQARPSALHRSRQVPILRPADVAALDRRRTTRLRRTLSLPNLKAKPVLDLSQPAAHRLTLPPKLAQFLASLRSHAQHQAAEEAAAVAAAERSGREIIHRSTSFFTPPLHPPITRHTLRELDLGEILKNPQLRHDVVFDVNVQFRPNFDGERGRRKKEAGNKYWIAVMREIEKNCTCTTFNGRTLLPCTCSLKQPPHMHQQQSQPHKVGTPRGRQPHTPSSASFGPSRHGLSRIIPSRIPMLIQELRAICLSILPSGSSTDAPLLCHPSSPANPGSSSAQTQPPFAPFSSAKRAVDKPAQNTTKTATSSKNGEGQQQQPSSVRTTKTAMTNMTSLRAGMLGGPSWAASHHLLIAQTLDPHLITQQLNHGVLDVAGLVTFMGSILKLHCAPMRDEVIEKMVEVVCVDGDVAKGLRMCFEILELMKLVSGASSSGDDVCV